MARFDGTVVLVTGSSRNVGRAIAAFPREGTSVTVNAGSSGDTLEAAASDLDPRGYDVFPVLADVADLAAVERVERETCDAFGSIDILAPSQAIRPARPYRELSPQDRKRVVAVNLHSAPYLCRAVPPVIGSPGGGSVIAIGPGGGPVSREPPLAASLSRRGALLQSVVSELTPEPAAPHERGIA